MIISSLNKAMRDTIISTAFLSGPSLAKLLYAPLSTYPKVTSRSAPMVSPVLGNDLLVAIITDKA